jgi:hypothetical protein
VLVVEDDRVVFFEAHSTQFRRPTQKRRGFGAPKP